MDIYTRLSDLPDDMARPALAIGKFDGVHVGHARILARLVEYARRESRPAVVFTFDPPPRDILTPDRPTALLCDLEEKRKLIERAGVDALILYPTTREFLNQTAEEFFSETLVDRLRVARLVEGESFSFGRGREGRGERLKALCRDAKVALDVVPSAELDGSPISSSAIRAALRACDVVGAARRLGRRYRLKGVVGRGDQRGRELGFPTANLTQPTSLLPGAALYSAIVTLPNGERRRAAVNLGGNPTFGVDSVKIEAHLLEFSGDLYGAPLTIDFCEKIRDIVAFDSPDALLRQMRSDLEIARRAPWD